MAKHLGVCVLILLGGFAVLPVLGQPEAALSCEGRWRFPDPHCLELVPKPELRRASGIVRHGPPWMAITRPMIVMANNWVRPPSPNIQLRLTDATMSSG